MPVAKVLARSRYFVHEIVRPPETAFARPGYSAKSCLSLVRLWRALSFVAEEFQ